MFFLTYLLRELRGRGRQAVVIGLGLALGVGLVMTVAAASAGVKKAQSGVLGALDGVGTDVTVTGVEPGPSVPGSGQQSVQNLGMGPDGPQICTNGNCVNAAGRTISFVNTPYSPISASEVRAVARLHGVAAAAGGLTLFDQTATFPKVPTRIPTALNNVYVDGVDTANTSIGPLSAATLTSGHSFSAADSDAAVAVVDSGYATSRNLRVGSAVTVAQASYTVIGIVSQSQITNPVDLYIPLRQAQAMNTQMMGALSGKVNTIYVTAASAADVPLVQKEVSGLLPGTTIDTASSLASQVTGSVTSVARLASDLTTWLSVLVLIAAFAVASLLTMAAVTRRNAEFGTLKAIGWRSWRISIQVLGESAAIGAVGAVAGVVLGFAGEGIIDLVAPGLSANVSGNFRPLLARPGQPVGGPTANHVVPVPLHASVTLGTIALAVALAVFGGLLAGTFASWRIARLRPVTALARVG
jgi:putative ABC transport system permease protein